MLRQRKLYAILFALFIFVSGVFSPVVASKFSPIANVAYAQTTPPVGNFVGSGASSTNPDAIPGCGFIGTGTVLGCVAQFIYYVPFLISQFIAGIAATFFDWIMFQSISDSMYRIHFVENGWEIVRDLSNMAFIFVLLYIAIQTILGIGHGTKKAVATLIVVALFINFSMFFAKVIIDSGNILAHAFYNSIPPTQIVTDGNGAAPKSITTLIIAKVNPQRLMTTEVLGSNTSQYTFWESVYCHGLATADTNEYDDCKYAESHDSDISVSTGNISYFILITVIATIINCVLIWVFLSVAFMLLGRMVGLIFSIIISPLAFISKIVPGLSGMSYIGFDKWISDLLKMSFLPAIFLFFIYLVIKFIEPENFFGILFDSNLTGLEQVLAILVPFMLIIALLVISQKIAKSLSGEIGGMVGGAVGKMAAMAGGLALGGTALLGRATIGRGLNAISRSDTLKDGAAGKTKHFSDANMFGRLGNSFYQKASKTALLGTRGAARGTMDMRNTGLANFISKQAGIDLNKGTDLIGLGAAAGVGGYFGKQQKKVEEHKKFADSLGTNHHVFEHIDDAIRGKDDDIKKAKEGQRDAAGNLILDAQGNPVQAGVEHEQEKLNDLNRAVERAKIAGGEHYQDTQAYKTAKDLAITQEAARDAAQKIVSNLEKDKVALEKDKKGVEEDRKKTYLDTTRRQSGHKFAANETKTIDLGHGHSYTYIKKYGKDLGYESGAQWLKEVGEGFLKGAAVGGAAGAFAGPAAAMVGALGGGVIKAFQQSLMDYSGTTNRQVIDEHFHPEHFTGSKYTPGSSSGGGSHGGGGGGGGSHGGGGGGGHGGGGGGHH